MSLMLLEDILFHDWKGFGKEKKANPFGIGREERKEDGHVGAALFRFCLNARVCLEVCGNEDWRLTALPKTTAGKKRKNVEEGKGQGRGRLQRL